MNDRHCRDTTPKARVKGSCYKEILLIAGLTVMASLSGGLVSPFVMAAGPLACDGKTPLSDIPPYKGIFCGLPQVGQVVSGTLNMHVDINPRHIIASASDNPLTPPSVLYLSIKRYDGRSFPGGEEKKAPYDFVLDTKLLPNDSYTFGLGVYWYRGQFVIDHYSAEDAKDTRSIAGVRVANYVKTVTAANGVFWGLGINPSGAIYRNYRLVSGAGQARDLRQVRGQVQILSTLNNQWFAWNGTTWVQPVIEPIPVPTRPPTAPPTALQPPSEKIIVDNRSPSVLRVGAWCQSGTAGFFGQDSEKTCDNQPLKRFRWTPLLPTAGLYDVFVWWVNNDNRSPAAVYAVHHGTGEANRTFDQRTGGNQWVLHGRYFFAAGSAGNWVELSNANGGVVGADAVRFVPAQ